MNDRIRIGLEKKNGGNQSEMARFVGVTPQAVQKWVAGTSEPRGKNLKKTAEYLGMSELQLRFGSEEQRAPAAVEKVWTWPFSIQYEAFAALPPDERARVDKQIVFMVNEYHAQTKSKKTG